MNRESACFNPLNQVINLNRVCLKGSSMCCLQSFNPLNQVINLNLEVKDDNTDDFRGLVSIP